MDNKSGRILYFLRTGLITAIASAALIASLICEAHALPANAAVKTRAFSPNHASAQKLASIVQTFVTPEGALSVDERTNSLIVTDVEANLDVIERIIRRLDSEMPARTFYLKYADPLETAEKILRVLSPFDGVVIPDVRTHTIYVKTIPSRFDHIQSLIAEWDRQPPQVLIQADVLDVSTAKLKELGIEWELRLGYEGGEHDAVISINADRETPETPATGNISIGTPTVVLPAITDGAGNIITPAQVIPGSDFSAAIDALIEDGSTKTLSRPRILVLDGHPARFEVATLEPYANTRYTERGSAASLDIQFIDIGIILETVPHINDEGYIMMDIRPEVSTLVREEFFETTIIPDEGGAITNRIRVPVKAQNRASTMVMVRDGQTIAVGGLRTHQDNESIRKVPLLGDIPILGIPFRNLNQARDKRELIIFITPHITPASASSAEADKLGLMEPAGE
jgi:type II secretory pathway component GspD/PulD (secretin)